MIGDRPAEAELRVFQAALEADENDEARYGMLAEEIEHEPITPPPGRVRRATPLRRETRPRMVHTDRREP